MMREILFRGKRKDNGRWVYGFPFAVHSGLKIEGIETWDGERHLIDTETVGQWTGFVDNHGVKIYEGDIIDISKADYIWFTRSNRVIVEWDDAYAGFDPFVEYDRYFEIRTYAEKCIVLSNIYDNPEIMK